MQLPDIVEDGPSKRSRPVNLLLRNRTYEQIGSSSSIAASPAVVHFGGFTPGSSMQQLVRLTNTTATPQRLQVIAPTSDVFKVRHQLHEGGIAPGLSEVLLVQFCSDQLRYHYDIIRIHTQAGGLLVPLHAYPMTNGVRLLRRLDLGRVPLGEAASQQLQLACKVPLEFGFDVTVTRHNPCFTVGPLTGTVPANGSAAIAVTFTPTSLSTQELQLEVLVSEFNAQPMPVTITATGAAGLVQERLVKAASLSADRPLATASATRGEPASLGGAQQLRSSISSNKPQSRSWLVAQRQPEVPPGHHGVNCLLNQQPGKLGTKDIQSAIISRKQELQLQQQQLERVLAEGSAAGVDPLDSADAPASVKEALFQMLQQKGCPAGGRGIGAEPPSPAEVAKLTEARQCASQQQQAHTRDAASHRLQLQMQTDGALHVLQPPGNGDDGIPGGCSSSSSGGSGYPGLQGFTPQFMLLEGNDWRKRLRVAQRFINAVRVVMFRNRAQARLRKLKALTARLSGDKSLIAGAAVQELVLESTAVRRPGVEPTTLMQPAAVRLTQLPLCGSAAALSAAGLEGEQPASSYADFSTLHTVPYKAQYEYELLGYAVEEFPGLLPYCPPCEHQPLMTGAGEEGPGGLACGLLPPAVGEDLDTLPAGLCCSPFMNLELDSRYSSTKVFAGGPEQLQVRQYVYDSSAVREAAGSGGVRALAAAGHQPAN